MAKKKKRKPRTAPPQQQLSWWRSVPLSDLLRIAQRMKPSPPLDTSLIDAANAYAMFGRPTPHTEKRTKVSLLTPAKPQGRPKRQLPKIKPGRKPQMDVQQAVFDEHDRLNAAGEPFTYASLLQFAKDKFKKRAPNDERTVGRWLRRRPKKRPKKR